MKIASNIGPKSSLSCYNMHGRLGQRSIETSRYLSLPNRSIRASAGLGCVIALVLMLGDKPYEAAALMGMVIVSIIGMYILVYACGRVFRHSGRWTGVRALYAAFLLKLPMYFVLVGLVVHWVGLNAPVLMAMVGGISILPVVITAKTVSMYMMSTASQPDP